MGNRDPCASFSKHDTIVAVMNFTIVGFGGVGKTGYLDRLYVHKEHQGKDIAKNICNALEAVCQADIITTHASITAKPFL